MQRLAEVVAEVRAADGDGPLPHLTAPIAKVARRLTQPGE